MNELERRFPIYSRLLKLYPPAYRRRYEQEMLQLTADMLDAAPSELTRLSIWSKLWLDVPAGIISENLAFATGPMSKDTPRYVKLASVLSSLCLLPFFVLLAANFADRMVFNQTLFHSWFWRMPQLGVWVLQLPVAALAVAGICYLAYALFGPKNSRRTWYLRAIDLRRAWPVILPLVVAIGILVLVLFHDSVHCWAQNPAYLVTHLSADWRCTEISG